MKVLENCIILRVTNVFRSRQATPSKGNVFFSLVEASELWFMLFPIITVYIIQALVADVDVMRMEGS